MAPWPLTPPLKLCANHNQGSAIRVRYIFGIRQRGKKRARVLFLGIILLGKRGREERGAA